MAHVEHSLTSQEGRPVSVEDDHDHAHVEPLTPEGYVSIDYGFHGDFSAIDADSDLRLDLIQAGRSVGRAPGANEGSVDGQGGSMRGKARQGCVLR